jgi:hypothetical protein
MRGAIHPLPQYAFMAWCSVKAQGQLHLLPFLKVKQTEKRLLRVTFRPKREEVT